MMNDMDKTCGIIAVVLVVLLLLNMQKEYLMTHRSSHSSCSMAASEEQSVSAKQSLSVEPEAMETSKISEIDAISSLSDWTGEKTPDTKEEQMTKDFLDEVISSIDEDKLQEHMASGCNKSRAPTLKKITEAGSANRNAIISMPTHSKKLGSEGSIYEFMKLANPEKYAQLKKPKVKEDNYFNKTEAQYDAMKNN